MRSRLIHPSNGPQRLSGPVDGLPPTRKEATGRDVAIPPLWARCPGKAINQVASSRPWLRIPSPRVGCRGASRISSAAVGEIHPHSAPRESVPQRQPPASARSQWASTLECELPLVGPVVRCYRPLRAYDELRAELAPLKLGARAPSLGAQHSRPGGRPRLTLTFEFLLRGSTWSEAVGRFEHMVKW
jgi:hypothetical protein